MMYVKSGELIGFFILKKRRAQSLLEYAVLIATVAAAVSIAAFYTKQAFLGRMANIEARYGTP
jgi:hypothetical protein